MYLRDLGDVRQRLVCNLAATLGRMFLATSSFLGWGSNSHRSWFSEVLASPRQMHLQRQDVVPCMQSIVFAICHTECEKRCRCRARPVSEMYRSCSRDCSSWLEDSSFLITVMDHKASVAGLCRRRGPCMPGQLLWLVVPAALSGCCLTFPGWNSHAATVWLASPPGMGMPGSSSRAKCGGSTRKIRRRVREPRRQPPDPVRDARVLTSRITETSSASELLTVLDEHMNRKVFNEYHISAGMTKLARFKKPSVPCRLDCWLSCQHLQRGYKRRQRTLALGDLRIACGQRPSFNMHCQRFFLLCRFS